MPLRYLFYRCPVCGGQLMEEVASTPKRTVENHELDPEPGVIEFFCSGCGLVYEDLSSAIPMEGEKEASSVDVEDFVRKKKEEFIRCVPKKKKHGGGRPRTRSYIVLRRFLSAKYNPRIKPNLSDVEKALSAVVVATFKRSMFDPLHRGFPQFFQCPNCGAFHDGAAARFNIDLKHTPPRVRVPLPCGYWLDLRLRCSRCNWIIENQEGVFKCPNGCFSFRSEDIMKIVESLSFGNI